MYSASLLLRRQLTGYNLDSFFDRFATEFSMGTIKTSRNLLFQIRILGHRRGLKRICLLVRGTRDLRIEQPGNSRDKWRSLQEATPELEGVLRCSSPKRE